MHTRAGISTVATEILKQTALKTVMAAFTWPVALIALAGVIDNPWYEVETHTGVVCICVCVLFACVYVYVSSSVCVCVS
jgi:hypothetical protein